MERWMGTVDSRCVTCPLYLVTGVLTKPRSSVLFSATQRCISDRDGTLCLPVHVRSRHHLIMSAVYMLAPNKWCEGQLFLTRSRSPLIVLPSLPPLSLAAPAMCSPPSDGLPLRTTSLSRYLAHPFPVSSILPLFFLLCHVVCRVVFSLGIP